MVQIKPLIKQQKIAEKNTLSEILKQSKNGDRDAKKAWKLLNDLRDKFRK